MMARCEKMANEMGQREQSEAHVMRILTNESKLSSTKSEKYSHVSFLSADSGSISSNNNNNIGKVNL